MEGRHPYPMRSRSYRDSLMPYPGHLIGVGVSLKLLFNCFLDPLPESNSGGDYCYPSFVMQGIQHTYAYNLSLDFLDCVVHVARLPHVLRVEHPP